MTEKTETTTAGSARIPQPAAETGTGPDDGYLPVPREPDKRTVSVSRATALRNLSIGRPPEPKRSHRQRTHLIIRDKDGEIPYLKYEAAHRDLLCSLMERQDRMNEAILKRIIDPGCRIADTGDSKKTDGAKGVVS